MAKKSKGGSVPMSLVFTACALLFAVAAVAMIFLVTVNYTNSEGEVIEAFTGIQQMFGASKTGEYTSITTHYLGFSFLSLIPVILVIAGAVCTVLNNKLANLLSIVLLVVGGVLFFLMPSFATIATTVDGMPAADIVATKTAIAMLKNLTPTLGIGAILGGIFSIIAGAFAGLKVFKK